MVRNEQHFMKHAIVAHHKHVLQFTKNTVKIIQISFYHIINKVTRFYGGFFIFIQFQSVTELD